MCKRLGAITVFLILLPVLAWGEENYAQCRKRYPEAGMVRVGPVVMRRLLVAKELPQLVKGSDTLADVKVAVLIDEHGNVVCALALEGPSEIMEATFKAVKRWKFTPYRLPGGRPIVVDGYIYFHFRNKEVSAGFVR